MQALHIRFNHGILTLVLTTLLALLSLTLSGCGSEQERQESKLKESSQRLTQASTFKQQGQFGAAIIEAKNALKLNPGSYEAALLLVEINNTLGRHRTAITLLNNLEAKDANHTLEYGKAFIGLRKFRSAIDYLTERSDTIEPGLKNDYQLLLANAHLSLGNLTKATQAYQELLNFSDFKATSQVGLAKIALMQKDSVTANSLLSQVLKTQPNNIPALLLKADIAYGKREFDIAEDALSKALIEIPQTDIFTPERLTVLENLIATLSQQGRSSEALIYAKLIEEANPNAIEYQQKYQEAVKLYRNKELDEAEQLLTSLYEQTAADPTGILLGMTYYAKGDFSKAERLLTRHVDPEVAPQDAVKVLGITQLSTNQSQAFISLMQNSEDSNQDADIKALLGYAQISAGNTEQGEAQLLDAINAAPESSFPRITLARYRIQQRNFGDAQKLLQDGLNIANDNPLIAAELVRLYQQVNKLDDALSLAIDFQKKEADSPAFFILAGDTFLQKQNPSQAKEQYELALDKDNTNTQAKNGLARVMLAKQDYVSARSLYLEIIQLEPDSELAYKGLILSEELINPEQKLSEAMVNSILTKVNNNIVKAVLADYFLRNNKLGDAQSQLNSIDRSLKVTPYIDEVTINVTIAQANAAMAQQNQTLARDLASKALNRYPNNLQLLGFMARLELKEGRLDEAEKIAQVINDTYPNRLGVQDLIADIAFAKGEFDKSIAIYTAIWSSQQNDVTGRKLYSALKENALDKQAYDFLSRWITAAPTSPLPKFFLAIEEQSKGNFSESIRLYEIVLQDAPDNIIALNNLAFLYKEKGDPRALSTAEKAYSLAPENPAIMDTYAVLLAKNGDKNEAIRLLEKALEIDPSNSEISQHLEETKAL